MDIKPAQNNVFLNFDTSRVPTPCFVVDEVAIESNLRILADVQARSGAKILSALKAFSMWDLAPLVSRYLSGICASGLHEALLGREKYTGEIHAYSAAYSEADLREILKVADHIVFNSPSQWQRFRALANSARRESPQLQFGLRVNPEHSEGATPLYDPCAPGSRLGTTPGQLAGADLEGITGLHFHTLCEHDLPPLKRTLEAVENKFGDLLATVEWVNFGGGHLITEPGYQTNELVDLVKSFSARHNVQVYLEPGEAIAIHTGILVCEVLDIAESAFNPVILDTSATCHMPDTLEMPYRPTILGAGDPAEHEHGYRLGGMTCLAGDVIGDYSFKAPLNIGERLIFDDMAHYTMVKTSTFNGIQLPAIARWNSLTDTLSIVKEFGYADFRDRLS